MPTDLLSLGDIERRILEVDDALADETDNYAALSDEAASAEADYKAAYARAILAVAARGEKVTVTDKEARADYAAESEFRVWRIAEARRGASKEALLSYRARLDALRTLNANVRLQTAPPSPSHR